MKVGSVNEFDYFRKRLSQEDERARRTMGTEAELIHRALATHYAQRAVAALSRVAGNDTQDDLLKTA